MSPDWNNIHIRDGPVKRTTVIDLIFVQLQSHEQDKSSLRLLGKPGTNKSLQLYKYPRHIFTAKSYPSCANHALKRVELDIEETYPIVARSIKKFYEDYFIKLDSNEEAIKVFNKLQLLLCEHEFEQKKWIGSSVTVIEANLEDGKTISNTMQVEDESNTEGSSVLGL